MSSEETGQTIVVKTVPAAADTSSSEGKGKWKCTVSDRHIHREDVNKVWKECHEESFWYRALPFSLGSMALTGGLIYNGVWKSSKRFGPFPKLAIAGILGYAVGKASYMGTCRRKFKDLGLGPGPWGEGGHPGSFGPPGQMWQKRSCNHVCEECKKTSPASPAEQGQA